MSCNPSVEEVVGSRNGNRTKANRKYRVTVDEDTDDENDAISALEGAIPSAIGALPLYDYKYQEIDEIRGTYDFDVEWGFEDSQSGEEPDSSEYRFSFQAAGAKITQSLSTISYHTSIGSSSDPTAVAAPDFGGAINVTKDKDGNRKVEGQDVNPPPEVFTLVYRATDVNIDGTYQTLCEGLCGKVNNATFRGRAAGTTMLVRVQGNRSGGIWTIEFGFAYIPNVTSLPVTADITVDAKDGMDLLWVYYTLVKYPDTEDIVPYPTSAYVERIFERADLTDLNLPV